MGWLGAGLGALGSGLLAGATGGMSLAIPAIAGGSMAEDAINEKDPYAIDWSSAPKLPEYQAGPSAIGGPDMRGIEAVRARALGTGESPWAAAMRERESAETLGQRGGLQTQTASEVARGQDALAMTGGLSSGSAERLQMSGAQQGLAQMQNLGRESSMRKQDIGIEDERQRQALLGQLPGMELAQLQPAMFNANLGQQEAERRAQYNAQRYGKEADIWGAAQQARIEAEA